MIKAAAFVPELASPMVIALAALPKTPGLPLVTLPPAISVPMVIEVGPV